MWPADEVIWSMNGAEATEQGNCSRFKGAVPPHSCVNNPVIVDLLPGAPYNRQSANCCRGGVLSSLSQDPVRSIASFQISVGSARFKGNDVVMPKAYSIGLPGYSCGRAFNVTPTRFPEDGGRRWTQSLQTWTVKCTYSQMKFSLSPTCCVSLSAFYDSDISYCPKCSCACQSNPSSKRCIQADEQPPYIRQANEKENEISPIVRCTQHMCPVRVHWHIKVSYKEYWRVKVTVTNFNVFKNYSDWNLVIEQPGFKNLTTIFSFENRSLLQHAHVDDVVMFWGVQYYNDMLLQYGDNGNVQTEMLMGKAADFTFRGGWGFPRSVAFNGDECVMPLPDDFPKLPKRSGAQPLRAAAPSVALLGAQVVLFFVLFMV
ncbi:COBRA-like protein 6 [Acorus calamus]|uniref:COBRA-like protein 6 n=1 Tax=Acorus calamus TaxID=4465 RepID=A0AAV9DM30_ACOCL|nr:COBRA-like protein 6 [Acorus calamus]